MNKLLLLSLACVVFGFSAQPSLASDPLMPVAPLREIAKPALPPKVSRPRRIWLAALHFVRPPFHYQSPEDRSAAALEGIQTQLMLNNVRF